MICSGDSRPIWCFCISCSTTAERDWVGRRFDRFGSFDGIPRRSATSSSAILLKLCGFFGSGIRFAIYPPDIPGHVPYSRSKLRFVSPLGFVQPAVADEGAEGG